MGTTSARWSPLDSGVVTGTLPNAGTSLPPGSEVGLVLSKGEQPATAPTVKGDSVADASAAVEQARLVLGAQLERESARTAGTVLRLVDGSGETVDPGTSLAAGSTVRLVVSTGPAAVETPAPTETQAPTPTEAAAAF